MPKAKRRRVEVQEALSSLAGASDSHVGAPVAPVGAPVMHVGEPVTHVGAPVAHAQTQESAGMVSLSDDQLDNVARRVAKPLEARRDEESPLEARRDEESPILEGHPDWTSVGKIPSSGARGRSRPNSSFDEFPDSTLWSEANRLLDNSLAQSTHEAYSNALDIFENFRLRNRMTNTWPPPLEQLIKFIAHCSLSNKAPITVKQYMSGIAFHCKIKNVEDLTQAFIIRKLLNGLERTSARKDNRLPVTFQLLQRLIAVLSVVCLSKYEELLFKAIFLIAYFGLFRISELVVSSLNCPVTNHVLLVENISIASGMLNIKLRSSKTDQLGKGVHVQIPPIKGQCCPVQAVQQFLSIRPSCNGAFFCHFSTQPVSRYQFNAVLKKALSALGLKDMSIRSHSFRIGAATEAALAGMSDNEIKSLGRWHSDAFKAYIRIPVSKLVSRALGNS